MWIFWLRVWNFESLHSPGMCRLLRVGGWRSGRGGFLYFGLGFRRHLCGNLPFGMLGV